MYTGRILVADRYPHPELSLLCRWLERKWSLHYERKRCSAVCSKSLLGPGSRGWGRTLQRPPKPAADCGGRGGGMPGSACRLQPRPPTGCPPAQMGARPGVVLTGWWTGAGEGEGAPCEGKLAGSQGTQGLPGAPLPAHFQGLMCKSKPKSEGNRDAEHVKEGSPQNPDSKLQGTHQGNQVKVLFQTFSKQVSLSLGVWVLTQKGDFKVKEQGYPWILGGRGRVWDTCLEQVSISPFLSP